MENILSASGSKLNYKAVILDILGIAFVYFVPAISHMLAWPVYLIEPMRIIVILAILHTGRINSFLIALTLPLFSFLISSHPSGLKTALITAELIVNAGLFFLLFNKVKNIFLLALIAIAASKLFYYAGKYIFLSTGAMEGDLISTPLYMQVIVTLVLSIYAYLVIRQKQ